MINKKDIPEAHYIEGEIEDYKNNPCINALPRLNSPQDTTKLLFSRPKVLEGEKHLPPHIRIHSMMGILTKFLYVTEQHIDLEQKIALQIRAGYLNRNLKNKDIEKLINNTDFEAISKNEEIINSTFCTALIGWSGTGKSTAVKKILSSYPQAIRHPEYDEYIQLVWLKIDAPHDGSAKSLCIHFFRAVDNALGTSYESLYVKERLSADSMLPNIARVAAMHSIGILVIDEIQHLSVAKSGGYEKILNFFVTMSNVIHVPILMIGTPIASKLFDSQLRSARRFSQIGEIPWDCIGKIRVNKKSEKNNWEKFLDRLFKLQWFATPTPLTSELVDEFWMACQGIPSVAVLLFYLTHVKAVNSRKEVITPNLIRQVYNREMKSIHPMIRALYSGRKEEITKFEDLSITKLHAKVKTTAAFSIDELTKEQEQKTTHSSSNEIEKTLIEFLIKGNVSEVLAIKTARQAIATYPNADLFTLMNKIPTLEDTSPQPKPKKSTKAVKLVPKYAENDLRVIADSPNPYESIKKAGYIWDFERFL